MKNDIHARFISCQEIIVCTGCKVYSRIHGCQPIYILFDTQLHTPDILGGCGKSHVYTRTILACVRIRFYLPLRERPRPQSRHTCMMLKWPTCSQNGTVSQNQHFWRGEGDMILMFWSPQLSAWKWTFLSPIIIIVGDEQKKWRGMIDSTFTRCQKIH